VENVPAIVIGAGVVGLAIARQIARSGAEVIVLEANPSIGMETSSRNSEVIHAGLYYQPGSLKAELCRRGKDQLYAYCRQRGVAHQRTGKIVVASSAREIATLGAYRENARRCGVDDIRDLSIEELSELEPGVVAQAAIFSPSTGIVDSHGLMLCLRDDIERAGGIVVCNSPVEGGRLQADLIELSVGGVDPMVIASKRVVNAAGLSAVKVAHSLQGVPPVTIPTQHYAQGQYFNFSGAAPFRHPVYPIATSASLGIHATPDMSGQIRFGPDLAWIDKVDYGFDHSRKPGFVEAIQRYYPGLDTDRLIPGHVGVRPKIVPAGAALADFLISGQSAHGVPGLVNLFGIESPGLTSVLAIADLVARIQ
jgi:L-2-hydroxyglutarate oxidase LhgO